MYQEKQCISCIIVRKNEKEENEHMWKNAMLLLVEHCADIWWQKSENSRKSIHLMVTDNH